DHASPVERALHLAWQVYLGLKRQPPSPWAELDATIQEALDILGPEIAEQKRKELEMYRRWPDHIQAIAEEVAAVTPMGEKFIFVDNDEMPGGFPGRLTLPFLEKDGQYWGPPPDDATAIRELDRLGREGSAFIAFAWPAFWWLDYYKGFHDYLRS